jgi:fatty-acid desaturase
MTWNFKIKSFQLLAFIGGPLVLLFHWDPLYFLLSFIFSWIVVHIGISVGMHRCFSHRSFVPKNKLILYILHFLSVINTVGSTITWTGTHRLHHKTADTDQDPHRIIGQPLLTRIKYWFNFWPSHQVSTRLIKDLASDPTHKWFHRNYFKILLTYMGILLLIDVDLFLYGYVVATMFSLHWISWITVGAHIFGHSDNDIGDSSKNTYIMGLLMWGEGWHNNHHADPRSFEFGWGNQPDLGKHLIKLIAKPESLQYHDRAQNE